MDKASTLALVREEAFQRKPQRFGRGGIPKNRLLDDGDNNIGNSSIINPAEANTLIPQTNPTRLLALDALSPTGQMVTVALTNRFITDPPPQFAGSGFGGPIVGIIEFGNGSVAMRVEVDVPLGRVDFLGSEAQDGVTMVSVPAGTLRVYARNDGRLIPASIFGLAQGVAELVTPSAPIAGAFSRSSLVKAETCYFTRPTTSLGPRRTIYVYCKDVGPAVPFITLGGQFLSSMNIPPFAKSCRIMRSPIAASLHIEFYDIYSFHLASPLDQFTVPGGQQCPDIPVPSAATWFSVNSVAPGDVVNFIEVEFQIGV